MMLKHLTMSEWVRIGVSISGHIWLVNHDFDKFGWLLLGIGCLPPMWDMIRKEEAAEKDEWEEKKSEIESGGPEAVRAWNRRMELDQLKRTASMDAVVIATILSLVWTGNLLWGSGIVDNEFSRGLQRGPFIECNLALIAICATWAVVAERRRRIARDKLLTFSNDAV